MTRGSNFVNHEEDGMKMGWKIVLCILLALVLVVGGFVAYV